MVWVWAPARGKSGGMQIGINTSLLEIEESLIIVYGPCSA